MKENRLRWYGHVIQREKRKAVKLIMKMNVDGKIGKEIPKERLLDTTEII